MYFRFVIFHLSKCLITILFLPVNIEESGPPRKKRAEAAAAKPAASVPVEAPKRSENAGTKKEHDKASDDFYFEKFRRQFRR